MHPAIGEVSKLCEAWGGRLNFVAKERWENLFYDPDAERRGYAHFPSPACGLYGVHWQSRRIFVVPDRARVMPVIHELAHVFASTKEPAHSEEYDFLGWEIALARQLGCYSAWSRGMTESVYIVEHDDHDGLEWGVLTRRDRAKVAAERLKRAGDLGLVDEALKPRPIR